MTATAPPLAVLERLVGWAQVVVESHRPGQLDRYGSATRR